MGKSLIEAATDGQRSLPSHSRSKCKFKSGHPPGLQGRAALGLAVEALGAAAAAGHDIRKVRSLLRDHADVGQDEQRVLPLLQWQHNYSSAGVSLAPSRGTLTSAACLSVLVTTARSLHGDLSDMHIIRHDSCW